MTRFLFYLVLSSCMLGGFWILRSPEEPILNTSLSFKNNRSIVVDAPDPLAHPILQLSDEQIEILLGSQFEKQSVIKSGDSFTAIFKNLGIEDGVRNTLHQSLSKLFDPTQIKVGDEYSVTYEDGLKNPVLLKYTIDPVNALVLDLKSGTARKFEKTITTKLDTLLGEVYGSLIQSVMQNGGPSDLADKMLSVLAWKIDFRQLQKGDKFKVIYEQKWVEGELYASGKLLAIAFEHDDQLFEGFLFDNGEGDEYFDAQGKNLSQAPLHFDIISSLFSKRRYHPVRHTYRAHLGMDFMADRGTAIVALKDGTILDARFKRANGNYVKIQHEGTLATQYLHLSAIAPGIAPGVKVKAGQKIGEVGSTGLSTGPHLCLRVWSNGKQSDPLKFDFDFRSGVSDENKTAFSERVSELQRVIKLDEVSDPII